MVSFTHMLLGALALSPLTSALFNLESARARCNIQVSHDKCGCNNNDFLQVNGRESGPIVSGNCQDLYTNHDGRTYTATDQIIFLILIS